MSLPLGPSSEPGTELRFKECFLGERMETGSWLEQLGGWWERTVTRGKNLQEEQILAK